MLKKKRGKKDVPFVRQLVTGLISQRPGFNPRLLHVGFVMDDMALGEVFLLI
jgi:hypothetical protein